MFPIACQECGTRVLAEKYSPRHTSVQWLRPDGEHCAHSATTDATTGRKTLCPALHATIDAAAREGSLPLTTRNEPTPGVLA